MEPFPSVNANPATDRRYELTQLWQEHTLGARGILGYQFAVCLGVLCRSTYWLVSFFMLTEEAPSLKVISSLESEFPYAATLLIYVVLERCFKLHLLKNRNMLKESEVALNEPVGPNKKLKLVDFKNDSNATFVEGFLLKITLSDLEILYKVPDKKYSTPRNKVFHSNFYVNDQLGKDYASRDAANREYLQAAKEHLIQASDQYFHQRIIVMNGVLLFES